MSNNKTTIIRLLAIATAAASTILLAGCWHDCDECPECPYADDHIIYSWKIPASQADCDLMVPPYPTTIFRSEATNNGGELDGGSSIVDRDGGSSIVDRDGHEVKKHCYKPCAAGEAPDEKTRIDWHHDGEFIVGVQKCTPGGGT